MRFPRVRFTVMGLMGIVMIIGIALGLVIMAVRTTQLVESYRSLAREFTEAEHPERWYAEDCDQEAAAARAQGEIGIAEKFDREAESGRSRAARHHRLAQIFKRATKDPWKPLPPGVRVSHRKPPPTAAELLARWLDTTGFPIQVILPACCMCLAIILIRRLPNQAIDVNSDP